MKRAPDLVKNIFVSVISQLMKTKAVSVENFKPFLILLKINRISECKEEKTNHHSTVSCFQ